MAAQESSAATAIRGTGDQAMAAFYLLHGIELVEVEHNPDARSSLDCTFWFNDPEGRIPKIQLLWPASAEGRYEAQVRALRKICAEKRSSHYSSKRGGRGGKSYGEQGR